MADDWKAGDIALCVSDLEWMIYPSGEPSDGPAMGFVGEVLRVVTHNIGEVLHDGLGFAGWPDEEFGAEYFVKIAPLTEDEKREFELDLREPVLLYDDSFTENAPRHSV